MNFDLASEHLVELAEEFDSPVEVLFDSEKVTLEGVYTDEISAYRAKRIWTDVFETNFLLDSGDDFAFSTEKEPSDHKFMLICNFRSACGRYAFWRLVNNQAPECQYLIETAHIPDGSAHHYELLRAPDLKPAGETADDGRAPSRIVKLLKALFS